MSASDPQSEFAQLGLPDSILQTLEKLGYETPSPIQKETIPLLLKNHDVIGQAQTGTGKTAAFALPMLANLDVSKRTPQCLVLAPTRELALQVAEALESYAKNIPGFQILPIYGGQSFTPQLKALSRGVHVVVGTPGRVMDHMRRKTLNLKSLKMLVLDEADEMLRMGFIDDVEWILEQTPDERQTALFSATMPTRIKRIADRFLKDPKVVQIKTKTQTADTINQRFWPVTGVNKLDALTRILEAEDFDAMIIFVRTKNATEELAEKLRARGFASAAINGDMQQQQRERSINGLKKGSLDILVATDVAARGLDVDRITHVVNFDIPYDPESYVHRIGRTGRAGRTGEAILFVAPREKGMLRTIERVSGKKIERMTLPTTEIINSKRVDTFKQQITDTLASEDLTLFKEIIEAYQYEHNTSGVDLAAALASLWKRDKPLLLKELKESHKKQQDWDSADSSQASRGRGRERSSSRGKGRDRGDSEFSSTPESLPQFPEIDMQRFTISVGRDQGIKPSNIVGAIANEADIESQYIGHIKLFDNFCTVDLPAGMPKEIKSLLKKVRVCGKPMNLAPATDGIPGSTSTGGGEPKGKKEYSRKKPEFDKSKKSHPKSDSSNKSTDKKAAKKKRRPSQD
jgi:ATP-dependent RNA helicase DeaD